MESFEHIKRNFSDNTIILIVIRNPYELLNSIYCQSINVMQIKKPYDFFYCEKNDTSRKDNKFNLYNFDYKKLISLYRSYFQKVVVIKHEDFDNFEFLREIFDLNDDFLRS